MSLSRLTRIGRPSEPLNSIFTKTIEIDETVGAMGRKNLRRLTISQQVAGYRVCLFVTLSTVYVLKP
jgi:hypothetical protein